VRERSDEAFRFLRSIFLISGYSKRPPRRETERGLQPGSRLFFCRGLGEREGQGSFMLTQISFMPTSRRCFGNPSSIVPYEAVCTKHRVLCTKQTRPSRGTPIPFRSASGPCGVAGSPLRICATAASGWWRRGDEMGRVSVAGPSYRFLSLSLSISLSSRSYAGASFTRREADISPSGKSEGAKGSG